MKEVFNLLQNPYGHALGAYESIIGFVHTHPRKGSGGFSPQDIAAIGELTLGNLKWANVPKPATFSTNSGEVLSILNKNSGIYDRMYFGVQYSKGYEAFSWNRGNASLKGFYQNIYCITGFGLSYLWRDYLNKTYNVEYSPKKR